MGICGVFFVFASNLKFQTIQYNNVNLIKRRVEAVFYILWGRSLDLVV